MIVGKDIATNVPEVTKKNYSFLISILGGGWGEGDGDLCRVPDIIVEIKRKVSESEQKRYV